MPRPTLTIATLLTGGLMTGMAMAEDLPGFTYVEACRIDGTSAVLRMVYEGGNCETTDGLEPRVELGGTAAMVIIPTMAISDVCIMQIVPNHVQKTIGIAPDTAKLDIVLLNPQLEPQGRQTVGVLADGVDCSAIGETF